MHATALKPQRDDSEGVVRCWTLIRRAVLTHDALPGDRLSALVSGIEIIREFEEAYGYTDACPPRFTPTPRDVSNMLPVLSWLCWIKAQNNGGRDFKLLVGRTRDIAWWKFAQRFGRSERQVQRWFDGAVAAVYSKFESEVWAMEIGAR